MEAAQMFEFMGESQHRSQRPLLVHHRDASLNCTLVLRRKPSEQPAASCYGLWTPVPCRWSTPVIANPFGEDDNNKAPCLQASRRTLIISVCPVMRELALPSLGRGENPVRVTVVPPSCTEGVRPSVLATRIVFTPISIL